MAIKYTGREKTANMDKYLGKVKKIANEGKKAVPKEAKEILYPVCPMLSRGIHQHRCINTECVAYKDGYCNALHTKIVVTYI